MTKEKQFDEIDVEVKTFRDFIKASHETHATFGVLWRLFLTKESKKMVYIMLLFTSIHILAMQLPAWILGKALDAQAAGDHREALLYLAKFGAVLVSSAFLLRLVIHKFEQMGHALYRTVELRFNQLYFDKSIGQLTKEGGFLTRSNIDEVRGRIYAVTNMMIWQAPGAIISSLLLWVMICFISLKIGVFLLGVYVWYGIWMAYLNFVVMKDFTPIERKEREITKKRGDIWENFTRVIMSGRADDETNQLQDLVNDFSFKCVTFWNIQYTNRSTWRNIGQMIILTSILIITLIDVESGALALGSLVPISMWSMALVFNLWQFGHMEKYVYWNMPKIQAMLDEIVKPNDVPNPENGIRLNGNEPFSIGFSRVSHAYGHADDYAVRDINFFLNSGEKLGLIGMSGSGKSTLVNALMRSFDTTNGQILIDGVSLRDLDLPNYRRHVAYIAQHPEVFSTTVRENVLYRLSNSEREKISDEEIWSVLKKMRLDTLMRKRNGLDTYVGTNGMKLSGGQRQRLLIASAIIAKARLVIIDEATSSLDPETERDVQEAIDIMLGNDITAIVIAHRLPTLKKCDSFLVLRPLDEVPEDGSQIEARGSDFEELHESSPTFRKYASLLGMTIAKKSSHRQMSICS